MTTWPERERRRYPRYPVSIEAKLHVPLPEHGSAILIAKVTVKNLCLNGAHARIHELKKRHAAVLMHARRKCSLVCQLPGGNVPSVLSGEVAWVDLRSDESRPRAYMGIELTDTDPEEREILAQFLESLARKA